jgi:hypothetical protein
MPLRERLLALRQSALDLERCGEDEIALVQVNRKIGARNLVDYLALRQLDIRDLQQNFTGTASVRSERCTEM